MKVTAIEPGTPAMDEFIDLPWRIYSGQWQWVPPFKSMLAWELTRQNHFFNHGRMQAFICEKEGRCVGRVVASVDDTLAEADVGHFGYFETIDDIRVTTALLEAACSWLKAEGKKRAHGPVNLNIYNTYRIQTEGFDTAPFIGEPRSPEYYKKHLATLGFAEEAFWKSWDLTPTLLEQLYEDLNQGAARFAEPLKDIRLESFDLENFDVECKLTYDVVLESFSHNYGFSSLTEAEWFTQFGSAKNSLFSQASFKAINSKNECVGFYTSFKDMAQVIAQMDGDHTKASLLAGYAGKGVVFHTIAVKSTERKSGIAQHLLSAVAKGALDHGCTHGIGALAKQGVAPAAKICDATRAYAVYSKEL